MSSSPDLFDPKDPLNQNDEEYLETLEKVHNRYFDSLNKATQDAIYEYTNDMFSDINTYLRNDQFDPNLAQYNKGSKLHEYVNMVINYRRLIQEAIDQAPPLTQSIIVYRGLSSLDLNHDLQAKLSNLQVGDQVSLFQSSFISTTFKSLIAYQFGSTNRGQPNCCMYMLYLPKGTRGLYLGQNSGNSQESEFLMSPGHEFRVIQFPKDQFPLQFDPKLIHQFSYNARPIRMYRLAYNDFKNP